MKLRAPHSAFRRRQGIALLLVLVMATLLAAVAVSMVANLRLDRLASANYQDIQAARALIPQAVAKCFENMTLSAALSNRFFERDATTGSLLLRIAPDPSGNPDLHGLHRIFPAAGTDNGGPLKGADLRSLTTPGTLAYFTPAHSNQLVSPLLLSGGGINSFTLLRDSNNRVVGRFFAVLEDQSGFLDANAVGPVPRGVESATRIDYGRDSLDARGLDATVALAVDQGLAKPASVPPLDVRSEHGILHNGADIRTYLTPHAGGRPEDSGRLFTHFSRNPGGSITTNVTQMIAPLDLRRAADVEANGAQQTQFLNAFNRMGYNRRLFAGAGPTVSEFLLLGFLDYADTDPDARNIQFGATEPSALINEFLVLFEYQGTPTPVVGGFSHNLEVSLTAELFFPYLLPQNGDTVSQDFEFEARVNVTSGSGAAATLTLNENNLSFGNAANARWHWASTAKQNLSFVTASDNTSFNVTVNLVKAVVKTAATDADVVNPGPVASFSRDFAVGAALHAEALDPRFNHSLTERFADPALGNLALWRIRDLAASATNGVDITMGNSADYDTNVNKYARDEFSNPSRGLLYESGTHGGGPVKVENLLTFVQNADLLLVGELGYLPVGPWQTVKLIANSVRTSAPVSDYFFAGYPSAVTNGVRRGLVNPNTFEPNVLATVFHNMPVDRFPQNLARGQMDAPQEPLLLDNAVTGVPQALAELLVVPRGSPRGPYVNPASVYANPVPWAFLASLYPDELRQEAFFRNAVDLLNTRNQFYQILLYLQTVRQDGGEYIPVATEKVLLHVWRDAFSRAPTNAGAGGFLPPFPHPFFIQQMVYLND
jgi:hypothetical protein